MIQRDAQSMCPARSSALLALVSVFTLGLFTLPRLEASVTNLSLRRQAHALDTRLDACMHVLGQVVSGEW